MATYNGDKYLSEQLNSILSQTYTDWELLIADDQSNDNTLEIVKDICKKSSSISYYKNKNRLGPTQSFFNLLHRSRGEYTVFCDQDDIWFDDKLYILKKYINKNKIVFGFHNAKYLINSKEISRYLAVKDSDILYKSKPNLSFLNLIFSNKVVGCLSFGDTRKLQQKIQTKPSRLSTIYLDYWIALNFSLTSEIFYINEILSFYRRHSSVATELNRSFTIKFISRLFIFISLIRNSIYNIYYLFLIKYK